MAVVTRTQLNAQFQELRTEIANNGNTKVRVADANQNSFDTLDDLKAEKTAITPEVLTYLDTDIPTGEITIDWTVGRKAKFGKYPTFKCIHSGQYQPISPIPNNPVDPTSYIIPLGTVPLQTIISISI